ncbi:MAG: AsmA family protein [Burkholderiaceae bacterium]
MSEPGGKEEFAALDSARVAVAVMPLLSKQVQVRRIEVTGLKATLVKKKDGTLNIADLLGSANAVKPARGSRRWRHGEFADATRHRGHQDRQRATDLA